MIVGDRALVRYRYIISNSESPFEMRFDEAHS